MPAIQIRNLSEEAYKRLQQRAEQDRRSLQQEAAWILESALQSGAPWAYFQVPLHQPDWTHVNEVREKMQKRYGTLPDSTPQIRKMRDER